MTAATELWELQIRSGRITVGGLDECWSWMGRVDRHGYGAVSGRHAGLGLAHRLAYIATLGEIPEGMTLDHLCHNADDACVDGSLCLHRRCVNPRHLEPVSPAVNSSGHRSALGQRDACRWGHLFTEENTRWAVRTSGRGRSWRKRECRACDRRRTSEYKARVLARRSGQEAAA